MDNDQGLGLKDGYGAVPKSPRLFEKITEAAVLDFVSWFRCEAFSWEEGRRSGGKICEEKSCNLSMYGAGDPKSSETSSCVSWINGQVAREGAEEIGDVCSWTVDECKQMLEEAIAGIHDHES